MGLYNAATPRFGAKFTIGQGVSSYVSRGVRCRPERRGDGKGKQDGERKELLIWKLARDVTAYEDCEFDGTNLSDQEFHRVDQGELNGRLRAVEGDEGRCVLSRSRLTTGKTMSMVECEGMRERLEKSEHLRSI